MTIEESRATDSGAGLGGSSAAPDGWPPIDPSAGADDPLGRLDVGLRTSGDVLDEARDARPAGLRRPAAVVFDTRRHPRRGGARAVGVELPRLRFRAEGAEVDPELDDRAGPGQLRLFGQVTAAPADLSPAQAVLGGPAGRAEAEVDDLGQFTLDGLVSGRHRLEIVLAGATVEIPPLDL